ncbi:MAG: NADH-quinone oxidoreductase subunit M [Phycisphaerae bacterium]|nr:NADH-quinone oxidoreductase subunit M [Phycisphaerae bacterium]
MTATQIMAAMLLIPLAGAAAGAFAPRTIAKHIGFASSLVVFGLSVLLAWEFPAWTTGAFWPGNADGTLSDGSSAVGLGVTFTLGVDSVSLLLILLTTFLTPLAILGSYTSVRTREREFFGWFQILLSAMLLAFMARDVIAFYIGYEFTIVPMLFLIAVFGGDNRRYAAIKFFVFTFVASVITLAGLIYVAAMRADAGNEWSFALVDLQQFARESLSKEQRFWVFTALMIGFCAKVPLFPLHSWLPLAHDQAPTGGSVILAGTLLKLGTYGIYRIALPMAPDAAVASTVFICMLAVIAIVAISLVCVAQRDVKKLVAYSSVSHMGVAMIGLFALNPTGVTGSVMYMINHGLSTGALFLCIGMMYERYHTKDMDKIGGLARRMPIWAFFMIFFTMTSVGLPGLNGFVSEVMCLLGAFMAQPLAELEYPGMMGPRWMLIAGIGSVILGALYMLFMVGKLVWGPLKEPHGHAHHGDATVPARGGVHSMHETHAGAHTGGAGATHAGLAHDSPHAAGHDQEYPLPPDLNVREICILTPIALLCVFIGLQPWPLLDVIAPSARETIAGYPEAVRDHLADLAADAQLNATTALLPATGTATATGTGTAPASSGALGSPLVIAP